MPVPRRECEREILLASDEGLSEANGVGYRSGLEIVRRDVGGRGGSCAHSSLSGKGILVGAGVPACTAGTTAAGCMGIIGGATGAPIAKPGHGEVGHGIIGIPGVNPPAGTPGQ